MPETLVINLAHGSKSIKGANSEGLMGPLKSCPKIQWDQQESLEFENTHWKPESFGS